MKAYLKRTFPRLYELPFILLDSRTMRQFKGYAKRRRASQLHKKQTPFVVVQVAGRMGFGAMLSATIRIHHFYESQGLRPVVRWTNPIYSPNPEAGQNWMGRYLTYQAQDHAEVADSPKYEAAIYTNWMDLSPTPIDGGLNSERAHELFSRSFAIPEAWMQKTEEFIQSGLSGKPFVAVHFRGTDKVHEAARVEWEAIRAAVDQELKRTGLDQIFVATDEPEFLEFMRAHFGADRAVDLACTEIFSGGLPPHFTAGDRQTKADEAWKTILVLSRASSLIRGQSHLSAWAKFINPELPVITLNPGQERGFPESEFS